MTKACLIDWVSGDNIVPWMTFDTIEDAVKARVCANSSWPVWVCEFDEEPVSYGPSRRAALDPRGPYGREKVAVYRPISQPLPFYDVDTVQHAKGA